MYICTGGKLVLFVDCLLIFNTRCICSLSIDVHLFLVIFVGGVRGPRGVLGEAWGALGVPWGEGPSAPNVMLVKASAFGKSTRLDANNSNQV